MAAITWLHLSDWHHGKENLNRDIVLRELLADIRTRTDIDQSLSRLDFVFFTGDLANEAASVEYDHAVSSFLVPVLREAGVGIDRLFVIPGNHDIDWDAVKHAAPTLQQPFADEDTVLDWQTDPKKLRRLVEPFENYQNFVDDFKPVGFGAFGDCRLVSVGDIAVGVLGCNSALMCARKRRDNGDPDDYNHLTVGEKQVDTPLQGIKAADVRIALIHHPFAWLSEVDRARISTDLISGCDFVLHGHEHDQQVHEIRGTWGNCVVIPGGAVYDRRDKANGYNLVHYDFDTGKGTVFLRKWNDAKKRWTVDYDRFKAGKYTFKNLRPTDNKSHSTGKSAKSSGMAPKFTEIRAKYLNYVCRRWENMDMRGLPTEGVADATPLDEVYVSLTAERTRQRSLDDIGADQRIEPSSDGQLPDGSSNRRLVGRTETVIEKVDLPQVVRDGARMVLLGDPGSGKTTLTHFLARQFALACSAESSRVLVHTSVMTYPAAIQAASTEPLDYGNTRLPILLRISDYALALESDRTLRLADALHIARGGCGVSQTDIQALFDTAINAGSAFVILDGLDEIADSKNRMEIVRRVDEFAIGIPAENLVLVTSRKDGYEGARLGGQFKTFTLQDMELPQIERFVMRRMVLFERNRSPSTATAMLIERALLKAREILDAVSENEGVRRLAANPLLLTVLCLTHHMNGNFPERRVELYETASRTLLEYWKGKSVTITEADRLLAPLAYWIHENSDSGLVEMDTARAQLRHYCADRYRLPPDHPTVETEVDDFLDRLIYQAGMFVERAPGKYAFLHGTFEEYWAARYLMRDITAAIDQIRSRRHDPRFVEVTQLAIASQSEETASLLIRMAVWSPEEEAPATGYVPSVYEFELRRDLTLAARCIGDCATIDSELVRHIGEELTDICLNDKRKALCEEQMNQAAKALRNLRNTSAYPDVMVRLRTGLNHGDEFVRMAAISAVANVGNSSPGIVSALIEKLYDREKMVRREACEALGILGAEMPAVVPALTAILTEDDFYEVIIAAVDALSMLRAGNPEVVEALLLVAKRYHGGNISKQAAVTIRLVGGVTQSLVSELLADLDNDRSGVRETAAIILGNLGVSSPEVTTPLMAKLTDPDKRVRCTAIEALTALDYRSTEFTDTLRIILESGWGSLLTAAVTAIGNLGMASPDLISQVVNHLNAKHGDVRLECVQALGKLAVGTPEVISSLRSIVDSAGWSDELQGAAIQALVAVRADMSPLIKKLVTVLGNNSGQYILQVTVAQVVGELGVTTSEAMWLLSTRIQRRTRSADAAWTALSRLVPQYEADCRRAGTLPTSSNPYV